MLQQPDLLNTLIIPIAVELVLFILKAVVVTLFAGFFVKRYVAPLVKKEKGTSVPHAPANEKNESDEEEEDSKKEN